MNASEIVTSRDNGKLKLARAVRDGREAGLVFIEGARLAGEAIRSGLEIRQILVSADFAGSGRFQELIGIVSKAQPEVVRIKTDVFHSIADTETPQGVVLLASRPAASLPVTLAGNGPVVLLDRVNNPSNLGAIVRAAEASGTWCLITTPGSADAFSPKALRASMGSAFRLPIIERVGHHEAITWAKARGLVTIAADISGTASYTDVDWTVPRLVVFGSEAHGLDEGDLALIDETIVIPMENEVESLNLAVSAGIILFEAKRQRDA